MKFGNGGNGGDVNTLYFAAGIGDEEHGLFGKLNPTTASATSLIQFSSDDIAISEGAGHMDITVTRAGDVSGTATVNFATFDQSQPGHASQKSDYEISLGKVTFAAGETSKIFRILIVDDLFDETNEVIDLILSNPTGAGVGIGSPNTAELTIIDNDAVAPTTNPIDTTAFFVRQHYLDFLNREPDAAGLAFWANQINACGMDAACIQRQRVHVSAAFFLSIEIPGDGRPGHPDAPGGLRQPTPALRPVPARHAGAPEGRRLRHARRAGAARSEQGRLLQRVRHAPRVRQPLPLDADQHGVRGRRCSPPPRSRPRRCGSSSSR